MSYPEDRMCIDIVREVMADEPDFEEVPVLQGSDAFVARMVLDQLGPVRPARSGAAAVLEAADKVAAHVQAIAEVRELVDDRVGAIVRCKDLLAIFDRLGV